MAVVQHHVRMQGMPFWIQRISASFVQSSSPATPRDPASNPAERRAPGAELLGLLRYDAGATHVGGISAPTCPKPARLPTQVHPVPMAVLPARVGPAFAWTGVSDAKT